jgi:type IV pilus assembly protein PilC
MPSYTFTAKDVKGKVIKGNIPAENEIEFLKKLKDRGLSVSRYQEIEIHEARTLKRFKTKDLVFITRQLAAMLTSGLTLVKSLDIMKDEVPGDSAKAIWRDIYETVQQGTSFSEALTRQKGAFPNFLISMISAGESSGQLDVIMQRVSEQYQKEAKLNNKIKGAMMYPIILGILCIVLVIGMFTFVMPTFAGLYEDPADMPALTKAVMAFSDSLRNFWYIYIGAVAVIIFSVWYAFRLVAVRYKWDKMIVKMPLVGPLVVKIYTGRFARTMSSLYASGIPMVECIRRSSDMLNNLYITEKFNDVVDEVKQGEPFSAAVTRTEIFDSMFCSILFVGEESGALDSILEKSSDYYEEEADAAVQRLVSLMEPVMIIIMGVAVGTLIAAVLPALYDSLGKISE